MTDGLAHFLRVVVDGLELPVLLILAAVTALAASEVGLLAGERAWGLRRMSTRATCATVEATARRRIGRADLLARAGPMLGLMGTLIPLGPGLAALGRGDVGELARAVTVAFDTTVLGLLIGLVGVAGSRLRRGWYGRLLDALESSDHA